MYCNGLGELCLSCWRNDTRVRGTLADRFDNIKEILPLPEQDREKIKGPELRLGDFSGPLDLLFYLIEKNEIDLFDIPVASLTAQYLTFLDDLEQLDMDMATDFLVTGATLVQLKSAMMLPREKTDNDKADPRDELVLRLLAYRRCKLIAAELAKREELYASVVFRLPENPASLGLTPPDPTAQYADETDFSAARFKRSREALRARNAARFQDLHDKMEYIISREQISLKDWIEKLWQILLAKTTVSFDEVFPARRSKQGRLTGFLAVLELLKQNRILVEQAMPFAEIRLSKYRGGDAE